MGIFPDLLYAVRIKPRNEEDLQNLFQKANIDFNTELMPLLFWMLNATSKIKNKKNSIKQIE